MEGPKGEFRTCFYIGAELVHIGSAGLCQDDIIAEVPNLHLLEVEHLLLAVLAGDVCNLVTEALQDCAPTGLFNAHTAASIGTLLHDGLMAGRAQPVIQPATGNCCQGP